MKQGKLYVVATPIGNLEDITKRAERILTQVSVIACEDTRHSRKLLSHLNISTPLTSYYRENEQFKTEHLLQKLLGGEDIALVSDAGTPSLSDPGSVLVGQARAAGVTIVPVPGPSALTAAISAAGLKENGFFFGGFPPAKRGERKTFFKSIATLPYPLVFYESPHRIRHCLKDCSETFGNREALLFRELTKMHEQHYRGTISDIREQLAGTVKGEIVLIIGAPAAHHEDKPDNLADLIRWYNDQPGMSLKDAVRHISSDLDLPRNKVYQEALSIWKKK
ncbi:MAG: 16S rRNA (cytidine(1402)-2'-O)-methyltransferase [Desulfobulbaceae bacterium]|nr:16S rRNA (cytidine(1402)-2'-O)-methyltransferase [Desulfobulbaceae bacterium]